MHKCFFIWLLRISYDYFDSTSSFQHYYHVITSASTSPRREKIA